MSTHLDHECRVVSVTEHGGKNFVDTKDVDMPEVREDLRKCAVTMVCFKTDRTVGQGDHEPLVKECSNGAPIIENRRRGSKDPTNNGADTTFKHVFLPYRCIKRTENNLQTYASPPLNAQKKTLKDAFIVFVFFVLVRFFFISLRFVLFGGRQTLDSGQWAPSLICHSVYPYVRMSVRGLVHKSIRILDY